MITSPAAEKPEEAVVSQEIVIEAGKTELHYWRDLWRYRELFYFLAWRDILVRYKQTAIGIAWAVIQPLSTTLVSVFIFQYIAKLPSVGNVPYALMVMAAQLPWQFFSRALSEASNSLISNTNLISKIYFPRLLVPASTLAVGFVDFAISLSILGMLMIWYEYVPDFRILAAPLFIVLTLTASLGAGLWLAALTVKYRDFRFITPFIVQVGFFVSPVWYSSNKFHGFERLIYSLNPMVGAIDGFRWAVFRGNVPIYWPGLILSTLTSLFLLTTAIMYFRKTEKSFVDMI